MDDRAAIDDSKQQATIKATLTAIMKETWNGMMEEGNMPNW